MVVIVELLLDPAQVGFFCAERVMFAAQGRGGAVEQCQCVHTYTPKCECGELHGEVF